VQKQHLCGRDVPEIARLAEGLPLAQDVFDQRGIAEIIGFILPQWPAGAHGQIDNQVAAGRRHIAPEIADSLHQG